MSGFHLTMLIEPISLANNFRLMTYHVCQSLIGLNYDHVSPKPVSGGTISHCDPRAPGCSHLIFKCTYLSEI